MLDGVVPPVSKMLWMCCFHFDAFSYGRLNIWRIVSIFQPRGILISSNLLSAFSLLRESGSLRRIGLVINSG